MEFEPLTSQSLSLVVPTLPHAEESSETWCHLLFLSELQILYLVKQAPGLLKGILCTLEVCEVFVVHGAQIAKPLELHRPLLQGGMQMSFILLSTWQAFLGAGMAPPTTVEWLLKMGSARCYAFPCLTLTSATAVPTLQRRKRGPRVALSAVFHVVPAHMFMLHF